MIIVKQLLMIKKGIFILTSRAIRLNELQSNMF